MPTRILLLIACALLSGCSNDDLDERVRVSAIQDTHGLSVKALPLPEGAAMLRAATAQGLVGFDAHGRVQPAMAERWIVTDDGLSYIFRLKEGSWNDGTPISADRVLRALRQRIAELQQRGHFPDELESIVRTVAMTDRVIEIDLSAPRPSLLDMLAHPEFGIVFDGVGSGPMRAERAPPPAEGLTLRTRLFDDQMRETKGRRAVMLRAERAAIAITRFGRDQTDVVTGGRFQDLPLLAASSVAGNAIRVDPVAGLFGLVVNSDRGVLSTPELREALTMAIDRPRLLTSFNVAGWQEAVTLVPEGLARRAGIGRPLWTTDPQEARVATARGRIAAWRKGGPAPTVTIALPDGPGSRILFARIAADWRAIGVEARRAAAGKTADLILIDEVADFDSPLFYLPQLNCRANRRCNRDAAALIDQARASGDLAARRDLLGQAELAMTRDGLFIPIASPLRFALVRPALSGFEVNPRGRHPLQYLGDPTTSR